MKKTLISLSALFFALSLNAQNLGVKAGTDFSKYAFGLEDLNASINSGLRHGFYVGGFYNYYFTESFAIQGEIQVSYSSSAFIASEDLMKSVGPKLEDVVMNNLYMEVSLQDHLQFNINS